MLRTVGFAIAVSIAACVVQSTAASATESAWEFDSSGQSQPYNNGNGYSLGEVFTVNENITLDYLGYYAYYDPLNAGVTMNETHDVAIYDASGNLLASTTISSAGCPCTPHFIYNPVYPVTLLAGHTYVLDGASGVSDSYTWNDNNFITYAPITLVGENWTLGSNDNFTGTSLGSDNSGVSDGYWGANFGWDASRVPEPITLSLFGAGLVGATVIRRRKKS